MNSERAVHYVSITSPNYLHDAHIRFALRVYADAICEKPLVLNPWNIDALQEIESDFRKKIYSILQLRLHPTIQSMKRQIAKNASARKRNIDLTYITGRGNWYRYSWKGDEEKSGGVATNIGVHFFDMLSWIFGAPQENIVHIKSWNRAAGYIELEKARVRWFLSLDVRDLPPKVAASGKRTYRSITVDGEPLEITDGFTDLHTRSYEEILAGRGFGLEENRLAVEIVHRIRRAEPEPSRGERHPLALNIPTKE